MGGWTLDDVCLVIAGPPTPDCGTDDTEPCDEPDVGGCCNTAGSGGEGAFALAVVTLGGVLVRRRRRVRTG
jgi:uncharacterized protein (TIGR03382 family)